MLVDVFAVISAVIDCRTVFLIIEYLGSDSRNKVNRNCLDNQGIRGYSIGVTSKFVN